MCVVYEIRDNTGWREVSSHEYDHFIGRKRVRPRGFRPGFYEVQNILLAYSGRL